MPSKDPVSLTGSECGAPPTHSASVSVALGRLRWGVFACCWIVTFALLVQVVVWALASFTDLRYGEITEVRQAPLIVTTDLGHEPQLRSALDASAKDVATRAPINPNRVLTKYDRILAIVASLSGGFGTLAVLALVPLIGLGVLLAAGSATAGVEKTVSAFGWSLAVAFLTMPIAPAIGLPWEGGGLWLYAQLTAEIDQAAQSGAAGLVFLVRYLLLPATCMVGAALAGARFSAGVEAGLLLRERLRLDPALEREAGGIRPGSLLGGRAAAAMSQTMKSDRAEARQSSASTPQTSSGQAPKRLI